MDPDRLLDGLDPSQRRAVTSDAAPLAILAGAGSGKTRVLTRRIAHRCLTGSADARHVLALTFTRRAAAELDGRLRSFGLRDLPAAGTFHAVAYAQLRTRWAGAGTTAPTLLDRKGRMLGRILGGTTRMSAADLATEIEWAKARLVAPDRYELAAAQADRRLPVAPDRIAEWYRRYEADKRSRGVIDFDDLLEHCTRAIETDPSFAAAQRWRFRHLFVDEYQDLNPLQERLLRSWLGDRVDLAVVGDPNQAVYGWNGADASFLVDFGHHHPGAEVVRLEHSYRSTPQIIATAAHVLGSGDPARAPQLVAHRSDGPPPVVVGYTTDVDEANGITRAVHDHHVPGRPWSAQAVLVRTNAQAGLIEAAFRRAAIPYRARGGRQLFDDADVKDLLRRLDRLHEPLATTLDDLASSIDRLRTDALEQRGLDPLDLDLDLDARDDLGQAHPTATAPDHGPEADEHTSAGRRIAAFELVLRLGRDLLVVDPHARADDLSGWLRATLSEDTPDQRDAVSIVSFHAAKGLEWSVVHVAGVEAGLVPITHARTEDALAEEQRLFYVAVTRAGDVLRCTWAAQRTFGTQSYERASSPYLTWIRAAAGELARTQLDAPAPLDALAGSRTVLERNAGHALATEQRHHLRTALEAWRRDLARQAAVRPTVILSDKALEQLVTHRPASDDELSTLRDVSSFARERHGARLLQIVAQHRTPEAACGSN